MLGQLLQVHRREHPHRYPVAMHLGVGPFRQPQAVVADQHPRAVDQRVHPAFVGTVEGERHEVQLAVLRGHLVALAGGHDMGDQRTVGHRHALGHAGGAGGVDHIGQVVAVQRHLWIMGGEAGPLLLAIHGQAGQPLGDRQKLQQVAMGQQQVRATVLHHVQQALARVFDVQRHVGAAGLQYRQERHHDLRAALHGDRHPHLGADASGDQRMGQAVGPAIQLGVGEFFLVEDHRHRIRRHTRPLGHSLVYQRRCRIARVAAVPDSADSAKLRLLEHLQIDQTSLRMFGECLQQSRQVATQALDRSGREQSAIVAELQ